MPEHLPLKITRAGRRAESNAPAAGSRRQRPASPLRPPLAASEEPARLVILPGLQTASGGPVMALATGGTRRPMVRALIGFGALVAAGAARGDA